MSDEVPEGDNIVGDRPADDKRILRTHLFLCHFAEAGTGPHFTQMHLLFQLQAAGGPASQMMDFLAQMVTFQSRDAVTATSLPRTKCLGIWREYQRCK